jgi:antitoxin HigA-1
MKKIRIAHPGEILFKEFIAANNLTVYRVAKDSGISQPTLQLITSGKRSITAETALRLDFGNAKVPAVPEALPNTRVRSP